MGACDFPTGHVLKATRDKSIMVIRVEFDTKDRQIAKIAEGDCAVLLPVENLDGKGPVHTDRD